MRPSTRSSALGISQQFRNHPFAPVDTALRESPFASGDLQLEGSCFLGFVCEVEVVEFDAGLYIVLVRNNMT